jgi:hypothetical protein
MDCSFEFFVWLAIDENRQNGNCGSSRREPGRVGLVLGWVVENLNGKDVFPLALVLDDGDMDHVEKRVCHGRDTVKKDQIGVTWGEIGNALDQVLPVVRNGVEV